MIGSDTIIFHEVLPGATLVFKLKVFDVKANLISWSILLLFKSECNNRIIKHSYFALPLWLLLSFSVICQAEVQTRRFIVEFKQNASFPKQSFSIKPGLLSQSVNPSDISDTNGCTGSDSPPDEKRHKLVSYELKRILLSWFHGSYFMPLNCLLLTNWSWTPITLLYAANVIHGYL